MIKFLLLLNALVLGTRECGDQWTQRSSSDIQVQLQETQANGQNSFTPVAIVFTPNAPIPENVTEILIMPAQSVNSCSQSQCNLNSDFDLVFFTKERKHFMKSEDVGFLSCSEVESCALESIPSPLSLATLDIPSIRPSDGPSVGPSVAPSLSPSDQPSLSPSESPTSSWPTLLPTRFPVVRMRLMLDEQLLWRKRNINLLKSMFSSMYNVPVEDVELTHVENNVDKGGVDVELEVRDRAKSNIDVSFENQVYITERLKDSSASVLEDDAEKNMLVRLDALKQAPAYDDLAQIICKSLSESNRDLKIHEVKMMGNQMHLTIAANLLENNGIVLDMDALTDPLMVRATYRRTLTLPIPKSQLFTSGGISRLKKALSNRLPGVAVEDITVVNVASETPSSVAIHLDITTDHPEQLTELTHEDEVFITEQILLDPNSEPTAVYIFGGCILALIFTPFIYLQSKRSSSYLEIKNLAHAHELLEPGAARVGELLIDVGHGYEQPMYNDNQKEGEESDYPLEDDSSSEVEGKVKEQGTPHLGVSSIVEPVLTDDEDYEDTKETDTSTAILVIHSPVIGNLTDNEYEDG